MKSVLAYSQTELKLETTEIPKATPGHVVVKMIASTIHPSDHLRYIGYFFPVEYPMKVGLGGYGLVVEDNEEDLKSGSSSLKDKFVGFWSLSASAWSEYSLVSRKDLLVINKFEKSDYGFAANFFLNPVTSLGLLDYLLKNKHSSVVIDAPAAQTSKYLIHLCNQNKIKSVCLARKQEDADAIKECNPTDVLFINESDFQDKLKKKIEEYGTKCLIDCVNGKEGFSFTQALPDNSELVYYGGLSGEGFSDEHKEVFKKRNIATTYFFFLNYFYALNEEEKAKVSEKIYKEANTTFKTTYNKTVNFTDAIKGVEEYLASKGKGKIIIQFE